MAPPPPADRGQSGRRNRPLLLVQPGCVRHDPGLQRGRDKSCGISRRSTHEHPVLPAAENIQCYSDFTSFLFPSPDPDDIYAILGLNREPAPGNGSFDGARPVSFKILAVPKCYCDNLEDCPAPLDDDLHFRLYAPDSDVVLIEEGDEGFSVVPQCENTFEGAVYFQIAIDDIGALEANLDVAPGEFETVWFQGITLNAGDDYNDHNICSLHLTNYPPCLDSSFWTGIFDETDWLLSLHHEAVDKQPEDHQRG